MADSRTKRLTTLAMMAAIACVVMFIHIPVSLPPTSFLSYDPKDAIIVMGGFMFGPLAAFMLAGITALVEMVTVSGTGPWGMLMNWVSSAAFAVPAAVVYKYRRTLPGAVIGLAAGVLTVIPVMLFWNWLVVPIYMIWPRAMVAELLVPVFLPFNAIKYSLNAAIALIIYKPVVRALIAAGLYRPITETPEGSRGRIHLGVLLTAVILAVGLALLIVYLNLREVT
ncbi:MAG: ECF transporter S component [Defluviitaleaceae bacterium]|nr:ECF transporter S component [Defluviitaleaceae bacterium]